MKMGGGIRIEKYALVFSSLFVSERVLNGEFISITVIMTYYYGKHRHEPPLNDWETINE